MTKYGGKPFLEIAEAFSGSTFLLTGATGYIGSLVLEQLLRTCPNVSCVLVLIRTKRDVSAQDRLQSLLDHELFHLVNYEQLQKVHLVEGDMLQIGCGISEKDRIQLDAVTHVVHGAASITFTDHILKSLATNYQAVKEVAALVCAACPALQAFTHISTAYVNTHLPSGSTVPERLLPARDADGRLIQHSAFVRQLLSLSPAAAEAKAACAFPNNYCLTKWLAEQMLVHDFPQLQLALIRPAIVGAVASKPIAGFVGNKSGATGAALAIAAGLWRYSQHLPSSIMDIVPGDTVASAVLLATAAAASPRKMLLDEAEPLIVHVGTSSSSSPLTSGRFYQNVRLYFKAHPLPAAARLGNIPERLLIVRSYLAGAALDAASEVWWRMAAAWLALTGRRHLACKVLDAWQAVKTFNHRQMQFDMRFETDQLQRLASFLPSSERAALGPWLDQCCSARSGCEFCAAGPLHSTTHPQSSAIVRRRASDGECQNNQDVPLSHGLWALYLSDYMMGARALVLKRPLLNHSSWHSAKE